MRYLSSLSSWSIKKQKAFRADLYVEECLPLYFHHFSDIISFVYFACKKVSLLAPEFQLLLIKMIWLWPEMEKAIEIAQMQKKAQKY